MNESTRISQNILQSPCIQEKCNTEGIHVFKRGSGERSWKSELVGFTVSGLKTDTGRATMVLNEFLTIDGHLKV